MLANGGDKYLGKEDNYNFLANGDDLKFLGKWKNTLTFLANGRLTQFCKI